MGVQLIWFRRARVVPLPPPVPRRTTPAKPKPLVPKERVPVVSVGGTPEFLADLGLHVGHPARGAEPVYRWRGIIRTLARTREPLAVVGIRAWQAIHAVPSD